MKNISDISLKGKKVLIRVDFNVPLDKHFNITDDSRIKAALPTIKKVIADGGKAIIMSHLGRPENGFEEKFSLKHTTKHLSNLLETEVGFSVDCIGGKTLTDISKMENGDVLVLENVRFYSQEKAGDNKFAKQLERKSDDFNINLRNHMNNVNCFEKEKKNLEKQNKLLEIQNFPTTFVVQSKTGEKNKYATHQVEIVGWPEKD